MKKFALLLTAAFSMTLILDSCSVQKRYHRKGFTVNWNNASVNMKKNRKVVHTETIQEDAFVSNTQQKKNLTKNYETPVSTDIASTSVAVPSIKNASPSTLEPVMVKNQASTATSAAKVMSKEDVKSTKKAAKKIIKANCHKQPSELFKKETTSINQIYESWDAIIEELHTWNPDLNIIFTVSPVRHIKDGLIANNRSKSRLSAAIELLERKKNISYFPSFEFINDVLRDYRFFNTDLIHPSDQAINEVWSLFDQAYLTTYNSEISQKIAKLNKAKRHKEMNKNTTESEKHQAWIEKQNLLINQLLNQSS